MPWTYSRTGTGALPCTRLSPLSSLSPSFASYLSSIYDDSTVCTQQAFLMSFLSHVLCLIKLFAFAAVSASLVKDKNMRQDEITIC